MGCGRRRRQTERNLASPPLNGGFLACPKSFRRCRGNHPAEIHPCRFRVGDLRPGHCSGYELNAGPCGWTDRTAVLRVGGTGLHSWPDAAFERTQPRRDVAVWHRRRAEPARGEGDERRSLAGGFRHLRHEPHENPATELAGLRTMDTRALAYPRHEPRMIYRAAAHPDC